MRRVYIASPFRGATVEETRQNIVYARLCMLDSLERGEAPYLSHLLYTQVFAETDELREAGLRAGDEWRRVADLLAVYDDLGITPGMQRAIDAAQVPVMRRQVHWRATGGVVPLDSVADWRARLAVVWLPDFAELGAR